MEIKPLAFPGADPATPEAPEISGEACGKCRFWNHDNAQKNEAGYLVAACRRFPPTIVVMPIQVPPNPRQIVGLKPEVARMVPQLTPVSAVTADAQWCGEFQPRTK